MGYNTLMVDLFNVGGYSENIKATSIANWNVLKMEGFLIELCSNAKFVFGFPPCTDLATSGAIHFESKRELNPNFQIDAVHLCRSVERIGVGAGVAWSLENPRSVLSTMWRKPNYSFDPCMFGGYLPEDDVHPEFPKFIAARDAYPKDTNLWQGNGFVNPPRKPVVLTSRLSTQYLKLGGKSFMTKRIRSCTPRGYFIGLSQLYKKD